MGDTIKRVNDTFDEMKGEVQAVLAIGDTVDNANALLVDVSVDLKQMAASGATLASDAAQIAAAIRSGKGTIGKLVNDDELHNRATAIATQAEDIAANARQVVENAKLTLEGFQSNDGPLVPERPEDERLTDSGKVRVDLALGPFLEHVASGIAVVEGFPQQGTRDEQYLRSRVRASIVRDYLIAKFHLDPQATGAMPLSADSLGSPGNAPWDGVALAVIVPKDALAPGR